MIWYDSCGAESVSAIAQGGTREFNTFAYTCCGLDSVTDENGRVSKYEYDQYTHRLKKVHEDYNGLNYVTEYTCDEVGNLKTVKNARLKTTSHTYDGADRLTRTDHPDSTHETWTYRDDGRVWTHTDARNRTTTYRYDADDRLAGSGSYKAIDYQYNARDWLTALVNGQVGHRRAIVAPPRPTSGLS